MLKTECGRCVWISRINGDLPQTVKSWTLTPWFAFKLFIGIAQPWRHVRGGRRLRRASLQTPQVLSLRLRWRMYRPIIELRMPFVEGTDALSFLGIESPGRVRKANELGDLTLRLARSGLRHRDFKLSNVIIESDTQEIWLIDPVGVVHDRDLVRSMACMLERLDVELSQGLAGDVSDAARLRRVVLRAALRPVTTNQRRAIVRLLRSHPRP